MQSKKVRRWQTEKDREEIGFFSMFIFEIHEGWKRKKAGKWKEISKDCKERIPAV